MGALFHISLVKSRGHYQTTVDVHPRKKRHKKFHRKKWQRKKRFRKKVSYKKRHRNQRHKKASEKKAFSKKSVIEKNVIETRVTIIDGPSRSSRLPPRLHYYRPLIHLYLLHYLILPVAIASVFLLSAAEARW